VATAAHKPSRSSEQQMTRPPCIVNRIPRSPDFYIRD
jgi:hypothetical protein